MQNAWSKKRDWYVETLQRHFVTICKDVFVTCCCQHTRHHHERCVPHTFYASFLVVSTEACCQTVMHCWHETGVRPGFHRLYIVITNTSQYKQRCGLCMFIHSVTSDFMCVLVCVCEHREDWTVSWKQLNQCCPVCHVWHEEVVMR